MSDDTRQSKTASGRTWERLRREPITSLSGVGPAVARRLASAGINTIEDLLTTYPHRYLDRTRIISIADARPGESVTVRARVANISLKRPRPKMSILELAIEDDSGSMRCTWFNQPFRQRDFEVGATYAFSGKVDAFRGRLQFSSPSYDRTESEESGLEVGRVVPVHPATAEVRPAFLRRLIAEALERAGEFADPLSRNERASLGVTDRTAAIRSIHFPESTRDVEPARRRLVVDEVLRLQIALAVRRRNYEAEARGIAHPPEPELVERLIASLPYRLTNAQQRVIAEIGQDLRSSVPMHRLLQGEVGSGKTVVAAAAMCTAIAGGRQGALMAPTEVLADQHHLGIRPLLEAIGVRVALLTGSITGSERGRVLEAIAAGKVDVVVGTHALVQSGVEFARLGIAVVDEQHRFGVRQRFSLRDKGRGGETPDLLIMTATPIPRTLAITLYGDLDVSILDEMPPGRRPVKTTLIEPTAREVAYAKMRQEAEKGLKSFVVCPLVEESEKLEATAAENEYERLRSGPLAALSLGLIHGRLPSAEKERVMAALREGEIDVLVATSVIEVGVDVPDATVIAVESAERFGISQLHQLRGRVGRGSAPGFCYLISDAETGAEARIRLDALVSHSDGFELAEEDLRIRGEGSLFGARQSGRTDLKLTRLIEDLPLIAEVREFARDLVSAEPGLTSHPLLLNEAESLYSDEVDWLSKS